MFQDRDAKADTIAQARTKRSSAQSIIFVQPDLHSHLNALKFNISQRLVNKLASISLQVTAALQVTIALMGR
jgi:hypothetical protein